MSAVPAYAVGAVDEPITARVAADVASLRTLADVLAWARRHAPPLRVEEIVTQDEYTHDVILPFDGRHFLAFDAT